MAWRVEPLYGIIVAVGCAPAPSTPSPYLTEFSAVQLVDYEEVSTEMNRLLEDLFAQRLVGRSWTDYADLASQASKREAAGDRDVYMFMLPVNENVRDHLHKDGLVHHPAVMIHVDRKRNVIVTCRLFEVRF